MPQKLKLSLANDKASSPHLDKEDFDAVAPMEEDPSYMMYMPQDGSFHHESSTVLDGSTGSSSQLLNSVAARRSSVSKQAFDASLKQLYFNENRAALDTAITHTIEMLHELSDENKQRPVFFPTDSAESDNVLLNSPRAHLALVKRNTDLESKNVGKAGIGLVDDNENAGDENDDPITLEGKDFKILKINLKMGHNDNKVMSTLDKKTISTLLEQKLVQQVKYLLNLKERVSDTSSKVFVTGDLNAGKSTFCNALLRRHVLPEDQQPCTSVFCEVIDAEKGNNGVEEVHAVPLGAEYDKRNERTYEKYPLDKLEDLVYQCENYGLLKVYVSDSRVAEESLLGNGVIDIQLIDAPGLNMDSYQTTQVFSRQEEIDLVVFVVNSENHFTLSAKEFIAAAAAEKRYVFIVVNRFDNIKDKDKCKSRILDQVKNLSPDTFKDAKDFVHFVSSSDVLDNFDHGSGGPDGDDGPGDNGPNFTDPDFDNLEASLRKFILDKRSISKLLPAKSYLLNILNDLKMLSEINQSIYLKDKESKQKELKDKIAPKFNYMVQESLSVSDRINKLVERTCSQAYEATRREIYDTVDSFGSSQFVTYRGLQYAHDYAKETQRKMIDTIVSSVVKSEQLARQFTQETVGEIVKYGKNTLGDEFLGDKVFNADLMFSRRKDSIKKKLDDLIEISDFFDPSFESVLAWLGIPSEHIEFTRGQFSAYSPSLLISSVPTSVDSLRKVVPTQLTLHTLYSSTKLLTTAALVRKANSFSNLLSPSVIKRAIVPIAIGVSGCMIFYLVSDIPNAFPRKQARKLRKQVRDLDYAHVNADRISKECRQVLNFPARQVMNNFQTSIDKRNVEKENLEREINDAELSRGYFLDMLDKIRRQHDAVDAIDLEGAHIVD